MLSYYLTYGMVDDEKQIGFSKRIEKKLQMINLSKFEEIKVCRRYGRMKLQILLLNITLLADAVGLDITIDETESFAGGFNVHIYASETGTDRKIIIENQIKDANHEHLGKLITYASGKSADIIIWLVKHAREEYKAAIEWLNNHIDGKFGFFLSEIKLYRIESFGSAVKFEVIEKPNDWRKEIKKNESTNATKHIDMTIGWTSKITLSKMCCFLKF